MKIEDVKTNRDGTFSSSGIWKLLTLDKSGKAFGKPALTYIEEVRIELDLGRSLSGADNGGKECTWGNLVEKRVFDLLPLHYLLESRTRFAHQEIKHWTGAPDLLTDKIIGDVKSPYTLKSFVQLVNSMQSVELFKDHAPEYYYQLVSNGILTNRNIAQIIVYVPYKRELEEIRAMAVEQGIWLDKDENLPFLIEGRKYKNINIFEFEIPEEDKEFLTKRVQEAVKLLSI